MSSISEKRYCLSCEIKPFLRETCKENYFVINQPELILINAALTSVTYIGNNFSDRTKAIFSTPGDILNSNVNSHKFTLAYIP